MAASLPVVIEPVELESHLNQPDILVVDLTSPTSYAQLHLPGAIYLEYSQILDNRPPTMGLLPSTDRLETLFSSLGISENTWVVAYDDEGGGKAGRLLWTLEVMGHEKISLLNGGLVSWAKEGHPVEHRPVKPVPARFEARPNGRPVASAEQVMDNLGKPGYALLDARSAEEYNGIKKFAERAGHIPGAINMDWVLALDPGKNLRLKPESELRQMLSTLGFDPSQQITVYCHTHHRSSLSYMMLKSLGFERIKGYPGSWSDWGNRTDTPVE